MIRDDDPPEIAAYKGYMADLFSRAAPIYDQVGPRFFSHFGRRLVELCKIPKGASVLDVACGRGAVLFPVSKSVGANGRVTGVDLSGNMVKETRASVAELGLENVDVLEMDAEKLDFSDASFDYVLCSLSIFIFPRPSLAIAEMRRVLKPGGRVGLTTFWRDDERWQWLGDLFAKYLPPSEETEDQEEEEDDEPDFRSPEGMRIFLDSAGFSDIVTQGEEVDLVYRSEGEWWETIWSHGMRGTLERIERTSGPDALSAFKDEAFEKLQGVRGSTGFHHMWSVLFTLATK